MEALFEALNQALGGSWFVAACGAFTWGILSIVLSPCHLASIPLVVAFVSEHGGGSRRRALGLSSVFAFGILVTIAVIGVISAACGRMLGDVGSYGNYFVALIFLLLGLHFLDVIPIPWSRSGVFSPKGKGWPAALLLGLVFGTSMGPCTFAFMAPMLGVTLTVSSQNQLWGALLLLIYGIGHCLVIVLAGASTELVQRYLNWNEQSKGTVRLRRVCGLLVIIGGFYLIYIQS